MRAPENATPKDRQGTPLPPRTLERLDRTLENFRQGRVGPAFHPDELRRLTEQWEAEDSPAPSRDPCAPDGH